MKYKEKTKDNILFEAARCLYCYDAPCIKACPASIDIPEFIKAISEEDPKRAAKLIYRENPFGAVCAEICPAEELCMGKCVLGKIGQSINIPVLQRYAVEHSFEKELNNYQGRKVAIIGAGPAGLACSYFLTKKGFYVKLFEKNKFHGGIIESMIDEKKLSEKAKSRDYAVIITKNMEIDYGKELGKNLNFKTVLDQFDAVVITTGLVSQKPKELNPNFKNAYSSHEFLRVLKDKKTNIGDHVVVVGGGDVALCCAVEAKKKAKRVSIIYRKGRDLMPASTIEKERADAMGITFHYLYSIKKISKTGTRFLLELAENTVSHTKGNRVEVVTAESPSFKLNCDTLVYAIGQNVDVQLFKKLGIVMENDLPAVGDDYQTSIDKVYMAGDIVNGGKTVVEAVRVAKNVADIIAEEHLGDLL